MKKEVQKPSALMTKIEVLKFRLKNSYQIPAAHHLNMVLFKGCSKTDFVRYLNCEHRLCDEAVLLLIKAPKSEAFPLWLRYNQYNRLSPECETAYIKKFGILQLLKNQPRQCHRQDKQHRQSQQEHVRLCQFYPLSHS